MNKELKEITIKALIENLVADNKFLSDEDLSFLCNKFVSSDKKLKDIENQIKYEIQKIEKKNIRKNKELEKQKNENVELNEKENEPLEYILYNYNTRGISSSKKIKLEKVHMGEENLNKPMHVIVNNNQKAYLKMNSTSLVDDVDLAISSIGKLLSIDVTDIFRVEDTKHNKGILSIDILNKNVKNNRTIGSIINANYSDILSKGKICSWTKEVMSLPECNKDNPIEDEVSIKTLIDLGYNIIFDEYSSMSQDEKNNYKRSYFNMLVFDFLTNQLDRNSENFGITIDNDNKIKFAPLYDNGCVVDYDNLNEDSTRFMMKIVKREYFIRTLFKYYFDDIKEFVGLIVNIKNKQEKIEEIIDLYLDENDALWYKGRIDYNIKVLRNLFNERINPKKNEELKKAGYVSVVQNSILVALSCILLGFIIGVILVIKTR